MAHDLDRYLTAYGEGFGYAFDNNIILNWYPERIIRLCPASMRLLEFGIGHGYTTDRFSSHFARHLVVDGSASVIRQFREQFPNCTTELVEAYFEDFRTDERFDVMVFGFVLEHVDDPQTILRRYREFLVSGGRCFVAVPNGASLHRRFGHAAGLLGDITSLGTGDLELGHQRLYTADSLTNELVRAGYQIVRKEGIFLKPFTTAQLQTLRLDPVILRAMCEVGIHFPELSCALLYEARV